MRYNFIVGFLSSLIFVILLSVVPSYAVTPDNDTCPPNPPSNGYDSSYVECVGTSVYYETNNVYYCGYIASSYPFDYYGSFISPTSSGYDLIVRGYVRVGQGGSFNRTDIKWQSFRRDTLTGGLTNGDSWSSAHTWNSEYRIIETYNNSIQYLVITSGVSLPSNVDLDSYAFFNDYYEVLPQWFYSYSEAEQFNLCVNFSHPTVIGEYDETVPTFTKANFNFSNILIDSITKVAANQGTISGELQSLLSDGTQYNPSEYYVDMRSTIKYNLSVMGGSEYSPTLTLAQSTSYNHFLYNSTDLSLQHFNDEFNRDMRLFVDGVPSAPSGRVRIVTADSIVLNVRLRRKSDGNYGNWLVIKADNVGDSVWNGREQPVSSGVSGIQYGSEPQEGSVSIIDGGLTEQTGIKVNFTIDGSALGSSSNGSRIYEGGGNHSRVDVGAITQTVKSVPQMFGVIFSFLPPEVLFFISTAFVTLIAVAIVKAIV